MELIQPAEREGLSVSVSQVTTFMLCPRKYEFRYVLGAQREHRASALVVGTAVHEALAAWYCWHLEGVEPDEQQFFAIYHESFTGQCDETPAVHLRNGRTLEDERADGVRMLSAFYVGAEAPERGGVLRGAKVAQRAGRPA